MRERILAVIEKNSRISVKELADLLGENEAAVAAEIAEMENEHIICGYHTLINWDNTDEEKVIALIEVKVTPQREMGFDKIAERIYQYSEVTSVYLMSGGYDFTVMIEAKTMRARVSTRNMAMSRQKKLDKMDVIELAKEKPKPEFNFLEARAAGKCIFETEDLVIGYDEPLSRPLNLYMERGEKIAMVGANGIGKTTLLKSILGLIPAVSGKVTLGDYLSIGYFEQEMAPGNTTTCIDEIWKEFPSYTQYQVRSALAKCGLTTQHIESQVRVLSGGEQAKVRLCKLINRETNLLLLDEPTNHLDVEAKEELKRALAAYKGSILLICHEPDFYEEFATKVWDCSEWSLKI